MTDRYPTMADRYGPQWRLNYNKTRAQLETPPGPDMVSGPLPMTEHRQEKARQIAKGYGATEDNVLSMAQFRAKREGR